ncbi:MAG: TolC family outer membrane protein [Syntrophales bacterium]|jgi:adhesin transport system outer membrane protein|nr:TolC family outer membrane protein [Syntrophales bacterium]MCK9528049.1 TolC family outer membrane protein [Syntrophales bacterium]MDX9922356.1 TolC family outer membrane protein [Syntrophales bacterium]
MWGTFLKRAVVVAAGALILACGHAWADETPGPAGGETLKDAIQSVLQTHPEIKAAAYGRTARDWEVVQAWSSFFPTLDGYMSYGYQKQDKPSLLDDTSYPKQNVLSLRQNVFRGGANLADIKRQEARVKSQAYLVQGTSENMALMTARVYMNVLRNTKLHELANENLVNHERIADQVELRLRAGVDAKAEMEQVMGRLALAKSNVVVTSANLRDAVTDYHALLGWLPEDLDEVEPLDVTLPGALEDAEQAALTNHPVIKSAKADLEAREEQHNVAKRILSPSVDLAANYYWNKNVDPYAGRRRYLTATATASMNFFSGGRDYGRIQETSYLLKEAEEILHNTRRQTVQSIRLSWEAYKSTMERVVYLEEYVEAAVATAEAFATQWNIGRRTMFDLLDTQAEAINARSDLIRAQYDLVYAEYRILNSLGMLVHSVGLEWPDEGRVEGDE